MLRIAIASAFVLGCVLGSMVNIFLTLCGVFLVGLAGVLIYDRVRGFFRREPAPVTAKTIWVEVPEPSQHPVTACLDLGVGVLNTFATALNRKRNER